MKITQKNEEQSNSLVNKLRGKIRLLEEENMNLFNEINLKEEEIHGLSTEIDELLNKIKQNEFEFEKILKQKEFENCELINKINEMEIHLQKYENDLVAIEANFERNLVELENEIRLKDNEIHRIKTKHENEKKGVINIFHIFILEKFFF